MCIRDRYTASGFAACGKLFHSLFGVDYMAAMVISAIVIVAYTTPVSYTHLDVYKRQVLLLN